MTTWAIVPAAGVGRRMGSATPKQYLELNGKTVIEHSVGRLLALPNIQRLVVALHPQDTYWPGLSLAHADQVQVCQGGATRQQSVLQALQSLQGVAEEADWVLVHDAVRPCVPLPDIENLLAQLDQHPVGGLLAAPVDSTLKQAAPDGTVAATVEREAYWLALTPQMFRFGLLASALQAAEDRGETCTDEAAAVESQGHRPRLVAGSRVNIKITHAGDLELAALILTAQETG